ncbi:helix-turn-helix transcriptional regulator [Nonomuraea sp. KC401]|uniref:ArsR/SmtB family transcription factor n=1 Tax=unclassified Nonomuraea TaxID=2593643 RepID=UPI0010FE1D7C|nr:MULTISPECIES: metalloregulator ArsR/SmtB family transcription factor [unclassified Nonomuraea]NBE95034.1 metalloregulator ArsR/SmtB family transcription factor [Nonomuraea sp. K271]TLF63990.1 helix-turn-helix transcriptional regulator [Nonomuraea sp. KC401]
MTVPTGQCCAPIAREPLDEDTAAELAVMLKAVADPVRLRLLSMIGSHAGGEACVCDLTGTFDLTAPTISHHLKVLRKAGLIDGERRGTWVYYRIIPEAVNKLGALFAPLTGSVSQPPEGRTGLELLPA